MPKPWTEELFWSYVQRTPDGCWEWKGARMRQGYGVTSQYGVIWRAHNGEGISQRELERRFPVSRPAIRSLLEGTTWGWLK